jgi:hypothetical protein
MGYDREELEDERRGIVQWLLDVAFGRRDDTDNEEGEKVHRVGTINRLLKED